MTLLQQLIDQIRQEDRLPDVVSERCVHEIVEMASCSSCVDVCPQHAWSLDDEALRLDTALCDGCGLCMPACPEGAVSIRHQILIGDWEQRKIVLCACDKAGITHKDGTIPCIHIVGIKDILKLYRKGYSEWFVATGRCTECMRNRGVKFSERVEQINSALSVNTITPISYRRLSSSEWQHISSLLVEDHAASRFSRRGFLQGMIEGGLRPISVIFNLYEGETDEYTTLGELIPAKGESSVWPYAPQIDAVQCNGCDACARLCPHGAIDLNDTGERMYYSVEPQLCSGCGICVDICNAQAISVNEWSRLKHRDVALERMKCSCCGNQVHVPTESRVRSQQHCRICAQVNHHKNLYQIVE
ncbi:MAG: 4Fe-4S binding protein [Candidatus Thiodiazotropha endolucinida]